MKSPTTKLPLFTQHSRHWEKNLYVYPVISRRSKGLSIGVNLNVDKVCNFDCIYCCVDRTTPATLKNVDLPRLADELHQMLSLGLSGELFNQDPFTATPPALRRVNDVAFSGDGEPTSYPSFGKACEAAADLIKQVSAQYPPADPVKIVVITNATLLARPSVAEALTYLDQHHGEIWAKLDAGTEEYYRLVERTSIPLQRVLENILTAGRIRPIVIQSLFMNVHGQPPVAEEITAYVRRLVDLKSAGCQIKLVQVYTVARTVAEAYVTPLPDEIVDDIARQVKAAGLPVESYYGPA